MPQQQTSRLGDLLLDMRLVDEDTLRGVLVEQRKTGKRLSSLLAERQVLDEERMTKAVAARLGLEAVSVSSHRIHERVLSLVPYEVAKRFGLLPIAIKKTPNSEILYLVMLDPLDSEALGEVQRLTGRQVRVLMATATELDQCIEAQYAAIEKRAVAADARPLASGSRGVAAGVSSPSLRSVTPNPFGASGASSAASSGETRLPSPSAAARSTLPNRPSSLPSDPQRPAAARGDLQRPGRPSSVEVRPANVPASRTRTDEPDSVRVSPPPFPAPGNSLGGPPEPDARASASSRAPQPEAKVPPLRPPLPKKTGTQQPVTLVDAAPPPEIAGLSNQLGLVESRVLPSEPDPPDAIETWIEHSPDPFAALGSARAPAPKPPPPRSTPPEDPSRSTNDGRGREEVEWDLAKDVPWEEDNVWGGAEEVSAPPGPSAPSRAMMGDDAEDVGVAASAPSALAEDGPEDIATSTFELSSGRKDPLEGPSVDPAPAPPEGRLLASTLEVPVDLPDDDNPFGGPEPGAVRAGLDRTGIFPAVDFEADTFEPPALTEGSAASSGVGLSDIPQSAEAVRARFDERKDASEASDETAEALDAVLIESPDVEASEPSSLSTAVGDATDGAREDESALPPVDAPAVALPPRRVPRAAPAPQARSGSAGAEEPTNPRFEPTSLRPPGPESIEAVTLPPEDAPLVEGGGGDVAPSKRKGELGRASQPVPQASRPTMPAFRLEEAAEAPPPTTPSRRDPVEELDEASASEEPTPAQGTVERSDVLFALDGAFTPPSAVTPAPADGPTKSPSPPDASAARMLDALVEGSSLGSSERAQLVLAIGRALLSKGLLTREELLAELSSDR